MASSGRFRGATDVDGERAPERSPAALDGRLVEERPPEPPAREDRPAGALVVPRAVWFGAVLAVLILVSAVAARVVMGGFADLNPFKGLVQQRTVDRSGPAVLKAVTDLGALQTASGYYEIVIDVEKGVDHVPSFLAGRRVLFVAAGTVDAGVDLRHLGSDAVTVDGSRTSATVRLAKPQVSPPHLDLGRSYVYDQKRGLMDRIGDAVSGSPEDLKPVYTLATQRLAQAATADGTLVDRAEVNARGVLQGLLRPLGFTDVTVTFTG